MRRVTARASKAIRLIVARPALARAWWTAWSRWKTRRWKCPRASSCATACSMAPAPGSRTRSAASRRYMSMRRRRPHCSRSQKAHPASTTLPKTMARFRASGRSANSASMQNFGSNLERLAQKPRALQPITPRLFDSLRDADAHAAHNVGLSLARAQFERRSIERQAVVTVGDADRLAQFARARAEQPLVGHAAPAAHQRQALGRLQRADQQ